MMDGTRVTIFKNALCKDEQDVIIFRRYTVPEYTFEDQASRGTIPIEAIPFFRSMVSLGYNVAFCGCVRSAKTTFLSTWQSLEDPMLEGVMVETDPEIPAHLLMPNAPIVQLLADEKKLASISKHLMRSDADYFILAEARDGVALDTAIRIAGKGSRRMKMTFHTRNPRKFTRDAAVEIVRSYGGDIHETALMVAGAFDFIFHFVHLRAANKKVLNKIYELGVSGEQEYMNEICAYDIKTDTWAWSDCISEDKLRYGEEEDPIAYEKFISELSMLSIDKHTGLPRYARNDTSVIARSEATRQSSSNDTSVIARSEATWQSSSVENSNAI
jgi:pilus assembly protein CpaF